MVNACPLTMGGEARHGDEVHDGHALQMYKSSTLLYPVGYQVMTIHTHAATVYRTTRTANLASLVIVHGPVT
jgi:hypothetical protein